MKQVLLVLVVALTLAAGQDCTPYGIRIQYGAVLLDHKNAEKAVISFNTPESCTTSFLRVLTKDGYRDISCQQQSTTASEKMNFFTINVQKCPLQSQIAFGEVFYYNVYGWAYNSTSDPTAGFGDWVRVSLFDPSSQSSFNAVVMADWGVIETPGFKPINDSLHELLLVKEVHLLLIVGDIAYDLDSKNGSQYVGFLEMAQEFMSFIPIVLVPGNHENLSEDDKLLERETFNLYGVETNLTSGLLLGTAYLLPFDPYNFVYFKQEPIDSLAALEDQLAAAVDSELFVIPFSHYPLVCSGEALFCKERLARMYPYFDAMLDAGVSLYLGAHTHDYERAYPYFHNQTFESMESPYEVKKDYLISVVEGVAGSNTTLIEELESLNSYTAAYTVN